jgi:hypothetical protein
LLLNSDASRWSRPSGLENESHAGHAWRNLDRQTDWDRFDEIRLRFI